MTEREEAARARDFALVREACGDADMLRIQERGLSPHSNAAHKHRNALDRIEATILADIEEMKRLRTILAELVEHASCGCAIVPCTCGCQDAVNAANAALKEADHVAMP